MFVFKPKTIPELIVDLNKINTKKDKIEFLKTLNHREDLLWLLKYTFDPSIKFRIKKIPVYKASKQPYGLTYRTINTVREKLSNMVEGGIFPEKRIKSSFLQILESVHRCEADLLVAMVKKRPVVHGLTLKIVMQAFPELIQLEQVEKEARFQKD